MYRLDANTVAAKNNGTVVACITTAGSAPAACVGTNVTSSIHSPGSGTTLFYGGLEKWLTGAATNVFFEPHLFRLLITGLNNTGF
jgi:hypothetical protein